MKKILSIVFAVMPFALFAQNVGINTTSPQAPLHIVAHSTQGIQVQAGPASTVAAIDLKTSAIPYDQLEIYKYVPGASGTIGGIALSGLSKITGGVGATAGLLTGTLTDHPMHFFTNLQERLRITGGGDFGIGVPLPQYKFHVVTSSGEAGLGLQNEIPTGQSLMSLGYGARSTGNGLVLLKFGPSAAGTAYGLPRSNLSLVTSDYGSGALVVGTGNNSSLHLGTNSSVKMEIRPDGNTAIGTTANNSARFHVRRQVDLVIGSSEFLAAVYGENGSSIDGSGVYGATASARAGATGFAGVTGNNVGTGTDRMGVVGMSSGTSSLSTLSAGVAGYGDNGVLGWTNSTSGAAVVAQHETGGTALDMNNGFMKVSGTNKTAFKHTTNATNVSSHLTILGYVNAASTDLLFVMHDYGDVGPYLTKHVGVWWNGSNWTIYNEDSSPMPQGLRFNVLVIKQ